MTITSTPGRFYVAAGGTEGGAEALVRAFLWLKRRIEQTRTSGLLALASAGALDDPLREALGWRLVDVLKDEGALPLGAGLTMSWRVLSELGRTSSGPIAAISPDVCDLRRLAGWRGPVLVVAAGQALREWKEITGAYLPPPEDFSYAT